MFNRLLDKIYFSKTIKELSNLSQDDIMFLKEIDDEQQLSRIYEKVKRKISDASLMSNTKEGIQRMNNWIECLEFLQKECSKATGGEEKKNYLTMKDIKEEKQ